MQSVNSAAVKQAPAESMVQLGQCVQRIIALLADNYDLDQPFLFSKLDIKDGFWWLDCGEREEWNFVYIFLHAEGEPIKLVVLTLLQMEWIESPPFFYTTAETGRNVAQQYIETPLGSLPHH